MILNLDNLKVIDWNISGIYKIENIYSGNIYIGQSKDIRKRLREHLECCISQNSSENTGLVLAWNKYGEGCFDFELLEKCTENQLDEKEIYWIAYYGSHKHGYNMTPGGQKNFNVSNWSDEDKKYFSDIKNPKPVLQIDLSGNIINEYWSVAQASKRNNYDSRGIYSCCNKGISKTANGYIWIYKKDYDSFDLDYYLSRKHKKAIEQYDMDGNLIKIWEHGCKVKEAGFSPSRINSCCNHKSMSAYGYIWKFVDDHTRIISKKYCDEARKKADSVKTSKIYQLNDNNNIIKIFKSLREVERNGFSRYLVSKCCKHEIEKYKNYIWLFENEYLTTTV